MPKRRKSRVTEKEAFYVDTNIALDYITGRDQEAITILDGLRKIGATIVSSSFLVMEAADFRKNHLYIIEKAIDKKWDAKSILRRLDKKDLKEGDFSKVSDWVIELKSKLKLELYDFLVDRDTWELAQYISQNSNLQAPDVIQLSSAIIATKAGIKTGRTLIPCKIFICNDGFLRDEAERIKKQQGITYPDILTLADIRRRFL